MPKDHKIMIISIVNYNCLNCLIEHLYDFFCASLDSKKRVRRRWPFRSKFGSDPASENIYVLQ